MKWQVYIFKSLVWRVWGLNPQGPNPPISQSGRQMLSSLSDTSGAFVIKRDGIKRYETTYNLI